MPLRPRNPTFVIVSVFLLSIAGCAANGPEIDRYHAPTSFGTKSVVCGVEPGRLGVSAGGGG